jgi:hypothetical protein
VRLCRRGSCPCSGRRAPRASPGTHRPAWAWAPPPRLQSSFLPGPHPTGYRLCAEDHAERADLVLHGVVTVLAELYGPASEDLPGQGVATLLQAGLRLDLPAVARFADQAQGVQGLGDPPVPGDGISSRSALHGKKNRCSSERCGTPRNAACPAACSSVRKFDRHPGPPNSRSTRPPKVLALDRPYVIFYSWVSGADLGFRCLISPGGDLRSWLRWLRCVEAERDGLAEQLEYAALLRGRC